MLKINECTISILALRLANIFFFQFYSSVMVMVSKITLVAYALHDGKNTVSCQQHQNDLILL